MISGFALKENFNRDQRFYGVIQVWKIPECLNSTKLWSVPVLEGSYPLTWLVFLGNWKNWSFAMRCK